MRFSFGQVPRVMDPLAPKVARRFTSALKRAWDISKAAGTPQVEWVMDNVMTQKYQGKLVQDEILRYLRDFTAHTQTLHEFVHGAYKSNVEAVQDGDKVSEADLIKAVEKTVAHVFGEDALAKLIARAIAVGENIY